MFSKKQIKDPYIKSTTLRGFCENLNIPTSCRSLTRGLAENIKGSHKLYNIIKKEK